MNNSNNQAGKFFQSVGEFPCHCMLIKVNNYDDFLANSRFSSTALTILAEIVSNNFVKLEIDFTIQLANDQIFLIFQVVNSTLIRRLAYAIYAESQLYIDKESPKIHFNISIASLNFPEDCQHKEQIFGILLRMLKHNSAPYYQNYNDAKHNLANFEQLNSDLYLLKHALNNRQLKFHYQPIVDRKTGEVPYYECLLRIPDQNQEFSIGSLITAAEANGLINIIDILALDMVVAELASDAKISLSVNISNYGILDEYLLSRAENLLQEHDVGNRLIIEVTETILNLDYEKTKKFMNRLSKYGCKFALDDFGAGFTSFKQLQNLPIDIVKIDGSYIKNIISNHQSKYFVEALVKISEELGIKTVAEFVENGEIAKFLIDIKVDGMQGNFFSPASSNKIS